MSNPLGDLEVSDPKAMRALAHPVRLAILSRLQRHGPATATQLAPLVGASPSVTSWHLRHLARFGLIRDSEPGEDRRERRWEALARGFRFAAPSDPDDEAGRLAARELSHQLFVNAARQTQRWLDDVEPELEPSWRRLSGVSNTGVALSREELDHIEDAIDQLLSPYVLRPEEERPADARDVRLLRYFMPSGTHR
jgi:DNA-binding transcriptional ArsR family regulator